MAASSIEVAPRAALAYWWLWGQNKRRWGMKIRRDEYDTWGPLVIGRWVLVWRDCLEKLLDFINFLLAILFYIIAKS